MGIIVLKDALAGGKKSFHAYQKWVMGGSRAEGYSRPHGAAYAVGAIAEGIIQGIHDPGDLANISARVARMRSYNTDYFVRALTGEDPTRHLWALRNGGLYLHSHVLEDVPNASLFVVN